MEYTLRPPGQRIYPSIVDDINGAVKNERSYQDAKHGPISQVPHTPAGWLLLIEDELNEAKRAIIKGGTGRDGWRSELVQVAALCQAALEQHGLNDTGRREI